MPDLCISWEDFPGLTVLTVGGEIDVSTAPDFRLALLGACGQSADRVILDLRNVTFFDCAGVGALVAARRRLPDGASLCLVATHPMIRKIIVLTGLSSAFPIHPSLLSATALSQG